MDDESEYDGGSEATLPSVESEISLSDYKRKKPCEICGSNANEKKLITCFFCNVTREHIYCMRVPKQFVPWVWMRDECLSPAVRANQVVDSIDQTATSLTNANQVVDNDVVHQNMSPSPEVEEASSPVPMDTSQVKKQKLPDSNLPSDSESEN